MDKPLYYRFVLHMTDAAWELVPKGDDRLPSPKRRAHRTLVGWSTVTFRVRRNIIGAALDALDPAYATGGVDKSSRIYLNEPE